MVSVANEEAGRSIPLSWTVMVAPPWVLKISFGHQMPHVHPFSRISFVQGHSHKQATPVLQMGGGGWSSGQKQIRPKIDREQPSVCPEALK